MYLKGGEKQYIYTYNSESIYKIFINKLVRVRTTGKTEHVRYEKIDDTFYYTTKLFKMSS